ncbi:hypothetical protein HNQ59_001477 [Chitinivorax tropicus]|uniref:DUF2970 domain-containing protein n=1 Tax=Chitinivorax tropicus TaxID=714531 RepID=A0A840MN68_9PROT|nr:DUF2970 domain-containing protein [Chitinivorax tropicus]MBB5018192.1 hypothetical protein [Chitinivorax tropicus]
MDEQQQRGFQAVKAIFWAFFGVRKGRDHAQDMAKLTPRQIILAGIIGGLIFVMTLVVVVRLVTS